MIDLTERIRKIREEKTKQLRTFEEDCYDVFRSLGRLSISMGLEEEHAFGDAFEFCLDCYARLLSHFVPSLTLDEPPSPLSEPMADAFYFQFAINDLTRFCDSEGKDFSSLFHSLQAVFALKDVHSR